MFLQATWCIQKNIHSLFHQHHLVVSIAPSIADWGMTQSNCSIWQGAMCNAEHIAKQCQEEDQSDPNEVGNLFKENRQGNKDKMLSEMEETEEQMDETTIDFI